MKRNSSLDALRGFAILAMVLSGSIAFGDVLPAWMFHAQVPPPTHKFNPEIPGISWVDLVFPFFLFSMGAAIPLSLSKMEDGAHAKVVLLAARRYVLLTFFAFFSFHMRAWVLGEAPGAREYLLSILGFVILFFALFEYKGEKKTLWAVIRGFAFIAAFVLLSSLSFKGNSFSFEKSDIIIIVLANMAFFGTLTWWFTRKRPFLRLGILPLVMAIFLGAKVPGSWNEIFFNYSPLPWVYKFYYLKYLFIIIPGTFAGEWLLQWKEERSGGTVRLAGLFSFLLIISNTALLFSRELLLNLLVSTVLVVSIYLLLRKQGSAQLLRFFGAGAFLLLLGLSFEAFEGGIRKDPSSYSYYFVTSGLAFFFLIGCSALAGTRPASGIMNYFALNGRNPMVAYVAGNLLLIPLLHLSGLYNSWASMNGNAWMGFARGLLFTAIVSLITVFFVRMRWFWKT